MLPQQKAPKKNLSKFIMKSQAMKKADGILLDAGPRLLLSLMMLIRLFPRLSCGILVRFQERAPVQDLAGIYTDIKTDSHLSCVY